MKTKLLLMSCCSIAFNVAFAQDVILFREKDNDQNAKVLEITDVAIKYKKWENLDGPTYSVPISTVSMIRYKNGQEDVFESKDNTDNETQASEPVIGKSAANNHDSVAGYPKIALVNVQYYIGDNNLHAVELETTDGQLLRHHVGIWGNVYVRSIAGVASNVRFPKTSQLKFIIQLEDPKANPFSVCELDFCIVKAQREFIDAKQGVHGVEKQSGVKVSFEKLNETGLYLIVFPKSIAVGEYFFNILNRNEVYAFGVDK